LSAIIGRDDLAVWSDFNVEKVFPVASAHPSNDECFFVKVRRRWEVRCTDEAFWRFGLRVNGRFLGGRLLRGRASRERN
jgi:hypothetical protein